MALDKEKLYKALKDVDIKGDIPLQMADAIDAYIRGIVVTVDVGIPVSTTGSATSQTGKTTATGKTTIS